MGSSPLLLLLAGEAREEEEGSFVLFPAINRWAIFRQPLRGVAGATLNRSDNPLHSTDLFLSPYHHVPRRKCEILRRDTASQIVLPGPTEVGR